MNALSQEEKQTALAKKKALEGILQGYGRVAVAFSGGVDSTFLLMAAREALGEDAFAVTAVAGIFPAREAREAQELCKKEGIRQILVPVQALEIPGFRENPPDRCYLCKKSLFSRMQETARSQGGAVLCEGSNMDDRGDYRPGLLAIKELGIKSPLREAGLYKREIRFLLQEMGLPTWDKPSCACLASRFPYKETITEEGLSRVDQAEEFLLGLGFSQMRVRVHGNLARIEVLEEDIPRLAGEGTRLAVQKRFRALGFAYVTMDLLGYRTGSLNEVLSEAEKKKNLLPE